MNAKVSPQTIEIVCPRCDEAIPETHSGSLFWAIGELPEGDVVECPYCERKLKVKIPKDTK